MKLAFLQVFPLLPPQALARLEYIQGGSLGGSPSKSVCSHSKSDEKSVKISFLIGT